MDKIPLRANYKREFSFLKKEITPMLLGVIKGGRFILDRDLRAFETNFAKYIGSKKAVGVASGTAALYLSLLALGIKEGDEVITTAMSFYATAEAIIMCGARPVFVDVLEDNLSIDHRQIKKVITKKTKAIIVVHMYGIPCEMDAIVSVCKRYKLFLVEDCAQAHGAKYHGKYVGTFGDLGCFSFMPAKNLGCYGEGGCITTNNVSLADKLIKLRNHGSSAVYVYDEKGASERLDNLQAAVLNIKLPYLKSWNARRNEIAKIYNAHLNHKYVSTVKIPKRCISSYYAYITIVQNRDLVARELSSKNIATGVIYPLPLHLQPVLKYLGYKAGDFPIVENMSKKILAIPMNPFLKEGEIKYIIREFNKAVALFNK